MARAKCWIVGKLERIGWTQHEAKGWRRIALGRSSVAAEIAATLPTGNALVATHWA
jgi:hypothetical protein